jgi:hypothetical protein
MKQIKLTATVIINGSSIESDDDLSRAIIETEQLINNSQSLSTITINGHKIIPRLHIHKILKEG